jgi:hypothetical protein
VTIKLKETEKETIEAWWVVVCKFDALGSGKLVNQLVSQWRN